MNVGQVPRGSDRYDIAVRFFERYRNDPEPHPRPGRASTQAGASVELRNVAEVVPSAVPVEINRYNRQRQITVLANLEQRQEGPGRRRRARSSGFTQAIGLPAGYQHRLDGQRRRSCRSRSATSCFTMILSVIVIYMVLAAQFESLVHPFTIMLSLPLAFVGALVALLLFRQTLNIFTMMAFIFLLGLVTKNAILLIDYTNTLRDRDGLPRDEALRRAGPVRLRPILMTTMAMIFGMLPVALGTGEGAESRQPMAIAIIGGLVSSTLLTLLVVPVVYSLLDPLSEWIRRNWLATKDTAATERQRAEPVETVEV